MASMVRALINTMAALNGQTISNEIISISIDAALNRLRDAANPEPPSLSYSAAASHQTPAPTPQPAPEQPRSSTPVAKNQPLRMRNVPDDLEQFIEALDELPSLNDSQAFPAMPSPTNNPRDPRLNKSIQ